MNGAGDRRIRPKRTGAVCDGRSGRLWSITRVHDEMVPVVAAPALQQCRTVQDVILDPMATADTRCDLGIAEVEGGWSFHGSLVRSAAAEAPDLHRLWAAHPSHDSA